MPPKRKPKPDLSVVEKPETTFEEEMELDANRQRIELCGFPGSGKTFALYALAEMLMVLDPDAKIYALDFDRGMGKVRPEWPDVDNIRFFRGRKWADVMEFVDTVSKVQTKRDWIFLDMIGKAWEMAQNFEIAIVHDNTAGLQLLEARRAMVEAKKLQGPGTFPQPDWTVIKRLHNEEFIDAITSEWDAHVIATTSLDPVDADRDDELIVSIFQQYGFKPDGEKRNAHRFDTVMFVMKKGPRRLLYTLKDRGRPLIDGVEVKGESIWDAYEEALQAEGSTWLPKSLSS